MVAGGSIRRVKSFDYGGETMEGFLIATMTVEQANEMITILYQIKEIFLWSFGAISAMFGLVVVLVFMTGKSDINSG